MAGLLDNILGSGFDDPRSAAMMALAGGLLSGRGAQGLGAGLLGANQAFSQAKQDALRQQMGQFQMQQAQMAMDKAKREEAMEMQIGAAAKGAYRSPELAAALSTGPMPNGGAMPTVQPGFDAQKFISELYGINPMKAVAFEQSMAKDNSPISVAPGASLVDRKTMQPVFTAPDKADKPPSAVQEYEYAQKQGYKGSFDQYQKDQKRAGASNVSVNTNDPTAVAKAAMGFQNDVRSAFKDHFAITDSYRSMQQAVKNPSAQGDTNLLYSFFKVLDPASTVREGEIDMVKQSRSIPDKFKGYAQKLANGQTLMDHERQDILTQAQRKVQSSAPRAKQDIQAYRENAKRLTLDPNLYVPDPYEGINHGTTSAKSGGPKFLGFEN